MTPSEPTTVLLVDDHELIRSGLASVIDLEADLDVVGTAGTVAEALAAIEELAARRRRRRPPAPRRHRASTSSAPCAGPTTGPAWSC